MASEKPAFPYQVGGPGQVAKLSEAQFSHLQNINGILPTQECY